MRFTRAGVLDVMQSNFVLYERAMGLPRSVIVWKYILRSALTSTVTQIGLLFGILLAGAVVTETVFDWPGIGTYAVNSIIRSDYNAVMGFTVWAGTIFIVVNLLVDVAHTARRSAGAHVVTAALFVLARLARDRSALVGLVLIAALVLAALLAPVLATHPDDVFELHPAEAPAAASGAHCSAPTGWAATSTAGSSSARASRSSSG